MTTSAIDSIGLFIMLSGFVIGLGAVTVIDIHGFLGRKSHYWTEATVRTHKVTKPMIWAGIALALLGGFIFYRADTISLIPIVHFVIAIILIINGLFLSFRVSPYLLQQEKLGRASELLPAYWQKRIITSLVVSDIGWWSALALLAYYLVIR
jgi:hypothetical protein